MATIVAKFTAKNATSNYITFAGLEDGTGVGLEVGGNGANTMTVTASENCTVIDCSTLAFYASENPAAPGVGGTFVPTASWTFINNSHKSWRGATARTILGKNLVGDSTTLIANNGYNYSYRCGGNFAKFKSWASVSGESTFSDDGEGGSIANPMNIRLGRGVTFPGLREDSVTLTAEIVEIHEKASAPKGATKNWAGQTITREDKGRRLRAILALGSQDVSDAATLIPLDSGVEVVGCSSDHTIVDVTDTGRAWKSGDTLTFRVRYSNMLYAFSGDHVTVEYRLD